MECDARQQFQFVCVADDDTYYVTRMHKDESLPEIARILLKHATRLETPPILIDVGGVGLGLCRHLQESGYPRIVRRAP